MIVANALAWALFHALWEGAIIALILAVSLWAVRSSHLRYLAACVALAATLAAFVVTLIHLIPAGYAVGPSPSLHAVPVGGSLPRFTPSAPAGIAMPPWIAPLWLAGVLVFQLRALGGWMAVRRLRRTGVCIAAEPWQTRLSELASRLGIARPVTLLQSSLAEVPVVIGHLRPVILMPIGLLTGLPCAQVGAILMHELAHIRRHDYLVNLLQTFAEGLLFYHPAVWWMSHVIRTDRENCCDDVVVASSGDVHEYATALAALAESRWATHDAAVAATGGNLVKRIRRLLKQSEGPRAALTPAVAASLIVVTFGVALVAYQLQQPQPAQAPHVAAPPAPVAPAPKPPAKLLAQAEQKTPAATPEKELATPWNKWLTEDVAYIITDAERNAFKQLGTDEERERFIEQFWLRRDPTPGTPENEFKEEHYRRIAFFKQHFSPPSGLPGWKKDRGRIYITFGPPDEIDSHPSGDADQPDPYENWRYRYISGIGDNVLIDFVGAEYRMTMDPNEKDAIVSPPNNLAVFASIGPGPKATVQVGVDRSLLISVPIEVDTAQFTVAASIIGAAKPIEFSSIGRLCGKSPGAGCLDRPVSQTRIAPLPPGTYSLRVAVRVVPPEIAARTYVVPQFTVK
jgi:GWxTD domain-containing protein